MARRKRKPFPSEIKYREKNPMVSFRLKKEEYNQLKETSRKRGKPVAQFVREIALGVKEKESASYKRGFNAGYKVAMEIDHFRIPCSNCGKAIAFTSKDKNWEDVVKPALYKAFINWHHTTCPVDTTKKIEKRSKK